MIQHGLRAPLAAAFLTLALASSGCIYGATGNVMGSYSAEHLVPYMMASDDVNMACHTGESLGSFLMSFERVSNPPDRAALVSMVAAGMCSEERARDAELRRLRAMREGRGAEAQDALSEEKKGHFLSARRFYDAYKRLAPIAGPVGEGACPTVQEQDQIFYLLGLSAGLLAVMHDKAADGTAGVPTDIPAAVLRASACISNEKWWGAPQALKAAIWVAAPPLKPADKDPWAELEAAVKIGNGSNVRLATAFEVQSNVTAGRREEAKKAITAFAAQTTPADPHWRLLDAYGAGMIQHESDKIWIEDTGHRTPYGQLGTFQQSASQAPPPGDDPFKE
jgi:hypothetical protein